MSNNTIAVMSHTFTDAGGGPVIKLLEANQRRVWVLVTIFSIGGNAVLCTAESGNLDSVIADASATGNQQYTRRDYGALVTGEWHCSNGSGVSPIITIIVVEGVLTT